ncbi:ATP-binding protein [Roseomonas terrae]|uniref:ATP-binding protein n=1 Tax=Neoroseomonas terrae TaxID=424799 RepID=A0ABS5EI65_9PROT|nr:ATP-binding protein [Neoroseomonas terrae]MBR0650728.1 ATP-binding protein [Neoroseomonas terrae]
MPNRVGAYELVDSDTRGLFPEGAPKSVVLSFSNDFDRVPALPKPSLDAARFSYGHPPSWGDLAGSWDVGRPLTRRIRAGIDAILKGDLPNEVIIILDETGVGKTTILRRIAYDLSKSGIICLDCIALSRLDTRKTAEVIDLIDGPVAIFVDNIAEQAPAIAAMRVNLEKKDVIFLGAERGYRRRHIVRSFGDVRYRFWDGLQLSRVEAKQLIEGYVKRGQAGTADATRRPEALAARIEGEPIAVACCHILNDMRPLDAIVKSTYDVASNGERFRYLTAAIAHYCIAGGVRYEILSSLYGQEGWDGQFRSHHPLPLEYLDVRRNFVIPLNATLAVRSLERAPSDDVRKVFEGLALRIAPRVNRDTIRNRSPEARLAGRLFDYDDVVSKFLGDKAGDFYTKTQKYWQWNSRYWEQLALFKLAKFKSEKDDLFLRQAVQHARHAVSIENHPFPLTTLGKILLAQLGYPGLSDAYSYDEAFKCLTRAIDLEHKRARASVHAYVTIFYGTLEYMKVGGILSVNQKSEIQTLLDSAQKYFPRDSELRGCAENLALRLSGFSGQ